MKSVIRNILKIMLTIMLTITVLPVIARAVEASEASETISIKTSTAYGPLFKVQGEYSSKVKAMCINYGHSMIISALTVDGVQKKIRKVKLGYSSSGSFNISTISTSPASTTEDHTTFSLENVDTYSVSIRSSAHVDSVLVTSVTVYYDDGTANSTFLTPNTAQTIKKGGYIKLTANDNTGNQVIWNVNNGNVELYEDETCQSSVGTDATSVKTVYAKGVEPGEATITVTNSTDNTKTASVNCTIIQTKRIDVITDATYGQGGTVDGLYNDTTGQYVLCTKNDEDNYVIDVIPSQGYVFGPIQSMGMGVNYYIAGDQIVITTEEIDQVELTFSKPLRIEFGDDHSGLLDSLVEQMRSMVKAEESCMIIPKNIFGLAESDAQSSAFKIQKDILSFMHSFIENGIDEGKYLFYVGRNKDMNENEIIAEKADTSTIWGDVENNTLYLQWYDYSSNNDGQSWEKGSGSPLVFKFERSIFDEGLDLAENEDDEIGKRFSLSKTSESLDITEKEEGHIEIDGKIVTEDDGVTYSDGCLQVTVSKDYLDKLDLGSHTLSAFFNEGLSVSSTFTIKEASPQEEKPSVAAYKIPKTGIE